MSFALVIDNDPGALLTSKAHKNKFKTKDFMSKEMQTMADYIISKLSALQKEVLTLEEAATFSGLSRSYIYKLTAAGDIPHYKPNGKHLYFERKELEAWLLRNRVSTNEEIRGKAEAYCLGGQRV